MRRVPRLGVALCGCCSCWAGIRCELASSKWPTRSLRAELRCEYCPRGSVADVFISYSHTDAVPARALAQRLVELKRTVWIDSRLEAGREFDTTIEQELERASCVIVLWSERSVASNWVRGEARRAHAREKLIAARLDDCTLPVDLDVLHTIDLRGFRAGEPHDGMDLVSARLKSLLDDSNIETDEQAAQAMRRLRKRIRELGTGGLLALTLAFAAVVGLAAGFPDWIPRMRWLSLRARQRVAPLVPSEDLQVVLIDEHTVREMRSWSLGPVPDCGIARGQLAGDFGPFWRLFHARAVQRLAAAGTRVIALDMAFPEASVKRSPLPEFGRISEMDPVSCGTAALARAINDARARGTAVFAVARTRNEAGELAVEPDILKALEPGSKAAGGLTHACIGQVGWANLVPLLFTGDDGLRALGLSAVSAFEHLTPDWDDEAHRLLLTSPERQARSLEYTGRGDEVDGTEEDCEVARLGQRPIYRVLDPFPRALGRNDSRVLAYEDVLHSTAWQGRVHGKIVLLGSALPKLDRHQACDDSGCHEMAGVSLQAAVIDTLFNRKAIAVIEPGWQLAWIAVLCAAVASLRFASARASAFRRIAELSVLLALDLAACFFLARYLGTLVDALYHVVAMVIIYRWVAWIEPAHKRLLS